MHNHGTLLTLAAIAGCSSLPNVMVTIGFNMFDPSHKISKHISIYQQKEHAKTHRTPKGYNSKVLLKEIYIYILHFHTVPSSWGLLYPKTLEDSKLFPTLRGFWSGRAPKVEFRTELVSAQRLYFAGCSWVEQQLVKHGMVSWKH